MIHADNERARRAARLSCWAIAAFAVAWSPGRITSIDAGARLEITRQLWTRNTVFTDDGLAMLRTERGYTTYTGIGQTLVFVPFDVMGSILASLTARNGQSAKYVSHLVIVFVYAPIVGVLWWWSAVRLAEELGSSRRSALAGALALFMSTTAGHYITQTVHDEALVGTMITASLLYAIRWTKTLAGRYLLLAGFLSGFAFLCRVNAIFAIVPPLMVISSALLNRRGARRERICGIAWGALGVAMPIALWLFFNHWRYGNAVASGYTILFEQTGRSLVGVPKLDVTWALLFGVGKGLFVLSPILIFALIGTLDTVSQWRFLRATVVLALGGSALFHSALYRGAADGSVSWGSRYQVHLLGPFLYPMILGIEASLAKWRWPRTIVVACVCVGCLFHVLSCMAPEALEYFQIEQQKGGYADEPLMGGTGGQLMCRSRNVGRWLSGENRFAAGTPQGVDQAIQRMEAAYMPNVWGPVYAKRFSGTALRGAVLGAWALFVIGWVACLLAAFRAMRDAWPSCALSMSTDSRRRPLT